MNFWTKNEDFEQCDLDRDERYFILARKLLHFYFKREYMYPLRKLEYPENVINLYRYGGSSRTASSYYGGSFGGSQDLIDMYGHETDSVFTDEEGANDHISFRAGSSNRICNYDRVRRYEEPSFPLRNRVLSDPAIHHHYNHQTNEDSNSDLYVNLHENLSLHSRQASQQSFMRSQQSLNSRNSAVSQPQRGDTIYGSNR